MEWVSVKFRASFAPPVFGLTDFIAQVTPGDPLNKLPSIQQSVPELDSLVWDAARGLFEGILRFDIDNYAAAGIPWKDENGLWNFTATVKVPVEGQDVDEIEVPRASWTIIRMITDRIFCVPAQTSSGPVWTPITGLYQLVAGEVSLFGDGGGGIGGGGWGGMQHSP